MSTPTDDYWVKLVSPHEIDAVWEFVGEGIEGACRRTGGDLTASWLWTECRSGRAYLIAVADSEKIIGASVWQFQNWTSGVRFKCIAGYGVNLKGWMGQLRELVTRMAKAGGAKALVVEGRIGWRRVFRNARIVRQIYEESI